jgi:CubicO group peptidase (beta-lactamase class C family)
MWVTRREYSSSIRAGPGVTNASAGVGSWDVVFGAGAESTGSVGTEAQGVKKHIFLGVVLLCFCRSLSAQAGLLPEAVKKAARDGIASGAYQTLVFAVVDDDRSEIVAFGWLPNHEKPDGDTVYEIGSITKTFTATLLADAVQSGRVQLDTPIQRLLPDLKIPSRGVKQITLVDIAAHRSGLPRMPTDFHDEKIPYPAYDFGKLKTFLATYKMPRDPGVEYEYSNLGFGLLGMALAESIHVSYGSLLEGEVLRPLQMKMTGTTLNATMRIHLAPGFDEAGKPASSWDFGRFDGFEGAGAIRSTAADMLRYLKANMGEGTDVLTRAMRFAQTPRCRTTEGNRIGLAWMTQSTEHGGIIWHNGGTAGYASFIGFRTDKRRGVVILANTAASVTELGFRYLTSDMP